jgi:hypothetical protein
MKHGSKSSSSERRHRDRRPVEGLNVLRPKSGRVIDLSSTGMGLETPERVEVGKTYAFRLKRGWRGHRLEGTVRWCVLRQAGRAVSKVSETHYRAGVAFELPGPSSQRFIAEVLRGIQGRKLLGLF